ncbi:hypothetical protein BDU57DRAFT_161684 [Ampelomyces quisqualis]|uniref:Heterokaryon incompatibility domain-containing protein n=1 Tax=Ampelomyces quisqualis TaxID=50730 RepID=A0A6A5QR34_AMPQU|nr:hypothetical protein BDU57DRAFT_161684 [Ampelomyces quisqualis]
MCSSFLRTHVLSAHMDCGALSEVQINTNRNEDQTPAKFQMKVLFPSPKPPGHVLIIYASPEWFIRSKAKFDVSRLKDDTCSEYPTLIEISTLVALLLSDKASSDPIYHACTTSFHGPFENPLQCDSLIQPRSNCTLKDKNIQKPRLRNFVPSVSGGRRTAFRKIGDVLTSEPRNTGSWRMELSQLDKIHGGCPTACQLGLKWVWIDSCYIHINKESVTEQSESTNCEFMAG